MKNRINTIDKNLQQSLSPEDVLQDLKEGNKRYMNVDLLPSELSSLRKDSVFGQFPKAMILSCIDSRFSYAAESFSSLLTPFDAISHPDF